MSVMPNLPLSSVGPQWVDSRLSPEGGKRTPSYSQRDRLMVCWMNAPSTSHRIGVRSLCSLARGLLGHFRRSPSPAGKDPSRCDRWSVRSRDLATFAP